MEKMASTRPWPVVLLACAALVAALAAAGVAAPRAALTAMPVVMFLEKNSSSKATSSGA